MRVGGNFIEAGVVVVLVNFNEFSSIDLNAQGTGMGFVL